MSAVTEPRISAQYRDIDGLSIRYADTGATRTDVALLFSPWPESLYAFHRVWPRLAEQARLIAFDLPGFGHSERRASLMTPRTMGEFIVRIADEFGIDTPHVVAPDVATGAALFAAADNPGRFRSLVVGSGGAVASELGGVLNEWVMADNLDRYRAIDSRRIVGATVIEGYVVPPDITEDYLSSYDGDRLVESMNYVRAYPEHLPVLAELLPTIETPVQILGGLWDFVVPPSNHRFLYRGLPHANLDLIDAGHFTWEERPDLYADIVTDWWVRGCAPDATGRVRIAAGVGDAI
jgi:pimeloyl-ACP methyl ester carboxylesterase